MFNNIVKKDPKYKKFNRMIKNGAYNIDFDHYIKELKGYHSTRIIRILTYDMIVGKEQKKLIEANIQNQSYRSRIVEIQNEFYILSSKLKDHMTILKKYIKTKYINSLKNSGYKTISSQNEAIDNLFSSAALLLKQLENLSQIAENIINDIDKATVSINSNIRILELRIKPERNI